MNYQVTFLALAPKPGTGGEMFTLYADPDAAVRRFNAERDANRPATLWARQDAQSEFLPQFVC